MAVKEYKKKPKINSKAGRYFLAQKAGKTNTEAKAIAGYHPELSETIIENTKTYQAIQEKLGEKLDAVITKHQVAEKLASNILQEKDINASNTAIKIYKEIQEPTEQSGTTENVLIVFQPDKKVSDISPANKNLLEGN